MQRDQRYDILKGIAIIMMVAFHARAPHCLAHFGNLFHMPVFFVLAGWFYSFKHSENAANCLHYVRKKFSRLYFPILFWGLVFVVFHNAFLSWHLISDLGIDVPVTTAYHPRYWGVDDYITNILGTPLIQSDTGKLAPFWFLQTLLCVLVGYSISSWIIKSMRMNVIVTQTFISAIVLIAGKYLTVPLVQYIGGPHTLSAYAVVHLGVLLHHFDLRIENLSKRNIIILTLIAFVVLLWLAQFGTVAFVANRFPGCLFLIASSIFGWYFLLGVSSIIPKCLQCPLAYIGAHTMPILLLHFLAFKLVSIAGVMINGDPICYIAELPCSYFGIGWCLAYTIVGVIVPLAVNYLYLQLKTRPKAL